MIVIYQVYIVDDDEIILNKIVKDVPWLDNSFEVVGSSEAPQKAIVDICNIRPHVVFTDLKMPGMDGIEMIKKLREKGVKSEFVVLSAYGDFFASQKLMEQDGFYYTLKPINLDEIISTLERLTKRLMDTVGQITMSSQGVPSAFVKLVNYVNQHYTEELSVKELGPQFGFSASYVSHLFKEHCDGSLNYHMLRLRMEEAAKQLVETDKLVQEIAIDCGYADDYFSKRFKFYHHMSPTQYRETHRKAKFCEE